MFSFERNTYDHPPYERSEQYNFQINIGHYSGIRSFQTTLIKCPYMHSSFLEKTIYDTSEWYSMTFLCNHTPRCHQRFPLLSFEWHWSSLDSDTNFHTAMHARPLNSLTSRISLHNTTEIFTTIIQQRPHALNIQSGSMSLQHKRFARRAFLKVINRLPPLPLYGH